MGRYKLGLTGGQKDHMDRQARQAGITSDVWQRNALSNGNFDILVEAAKTGRRIEIAKFIPTFDPVTGVYRFEVDESEPLSKKLARYPGLFPAGITSYATDEKYPVQPGASTHIMSARLHRFDRYATHEEVKALKPFGPHVGVDFATAFPVHPHLDENMPVAFAGQGWSDRCGSRYFLCLSRGRSGRRLGSLWLVPGGRWSGSWRFLVPAGSLGA